MFICSFCILFIVRVATSDPAQTFRGFAIQARESTETFSSEASFLGEFVNAPASGDWRIWSCDAVRQLVLINT